MIWAITVNPSTFPKYPPLKRRASLGERGFERGSRSCIGHELAMIELRLVIAAVIRRFGFVKTGVGEVYLDDKGLPLLEDNGYYKV